MNKDLQDLTSTYEQFETMVEEKARITATYFNGLRKCKLPLGLAVRLTTLYAAMRWRNIFEPACPLRKRLEK